MVSGDPGRIRINDLWICNGRKAKVHTYADMLYMWTWIGFLFAAIVLFIVQSDKYGKCYTIYSAACRISDISFGIHYQIQATDSGGICFWVIAILVHFAGPSLALLGTPVAMFTGYLIPGYMLKNKVNHDKV